MTIGCFSTNLSLVTLLLCLCALRCKTTNAKVSVGMYHACVVTADMTAKCWGRNEYGQLGNGNVEQQNTPVDVRSLSNVADVTSGYYHSCALLSSGHVKCWGNNEYGQLGDDTAADSLTPVSVQSLTSAVSVASGAMHSCAIDSSGQAYCWGHNGFGQIGDGLTTDFYAPYDVPLGTALAISAGTYHTCAVLSGGSVVCWGDNSFGQIGDGSTTRRQLPTSVSALASVKVSSIACGAFHTCALTSDGELYCWGSNENGQLGDGTTTTQSSPVVVPSLSSVTTIALGSYHSCAIVSGIISCFGRNNYGQVGTGTFSDTPSPSTVLSLTQITYIGLGFESTCAMTSSYQLRCWGSNFYGQLGDGTSTSFTGSYTVYGSLSATSIVSGSSSSHTCVVLSTGRASCWGSNSYGQLGDGTFAHRTIPTTVSSLSSISSVGVGSAHSCAIVSGAVSCWGDNSFGQLGDNTYTSSTVPVGVSSISTAIALALGALHSCALLSGGSIQCWGSNFIGQLGDGSSINRKVPVTVGSIGTAVAIAAGDYHTCAVLSDGSISCWGSNNFGQLGIGSQTPSVSPVTVAGLTSLTATSIALGSSHSCASISGLSMRCWGKNSDGQLGIGSISAYDATATTATGVSGISSIDCGGYFTCATLTSGTSKCWGSNNYGQLGDGTTTTSASPLSISALTGSLEVVTGQGHMCSRFSGDIKCWGVNVYGQLGNTDSFYQSYVVLSGPTSQPTGNPSSMPSSQPSRQPTTQPASRPTSQPTMQPSRQPSTQPSTLPTSQPSRQPSRQPSTQPTRQPTTQPTRQPSSLPSRRPSAQPTSQPISCPTRQPSSQPTRRPSAQPSHQPSRQPTDRPTKQPTTLPSRQPSGQPSTQPSVQPSSQPSRQPSDQPSLQPTGQPSRQPSRQPTDRPSSHPSGQPSGQPSTRPSVQPSSQPSRQPSDQPSLQPTGQPSQQPSRQPTDRPSSHPSGQPSGQPSARPSAYPSRQPSSQPSCWPTTRPSRLPSSLPTSQPSQQPAAKPSSRPSMQPTLTPSTRPTSAPSAKPSMQPSRHPSSRPSQQPSSRPTRRPSALPSTQPSTAPTSSPSLLPSAQPSSSPSTQSSGYPTSQPSRLPSSQPSDRPTSHPTTYPSNEPSKQPTGRPSLQPSASPTAQPSSQPSSPPSAIPSVLPSNQPTTIPSVAPTGAPTSQPTVIPSSQPSMQPFVRPSSQPSRQPSTLPTTRPSDDPTMQPSTRPTRLPSANPSNRPTMFPSTSPSGLPTKQPGVSPTSQPSASPSSQPSSVPTVLPSRQPKSQPSNQPTEQPSSHPTRQGTSAPTTLSQKVNDIIAGQLTNAVRELAVSSLQANGTLSGVLKTVQVSTDAYKASYSVIGSHALLNQTGNSSTSTARYSVFLPDSPTAVTLSLSGSSVAGTATALLIATTELPSTQFVSIRANTSNNNSVSAALPSPQLISSVVSIQVFQVGANGTAKPSVLPYFEASLTVSQTTNTSTSTATALVHNCSVGTFEEVSFYCHEAKIRLNLTCSGKAFAHVRRQCPVPRTVCSVMNLADNSIVSNDFCRAVSVGSTVLCKCGIEGDTAAANVSSLALTGKISVGAFRVYGSGSLTASVAIANSIPVSALAAKSMMIFASFGCVWGLGLILLALTTRSMAHAKAKAKDETVEASKGDAAGDSNSRSGHVQALLDLILPAYFTSTVTRERRTWLPQRWWQVLRACHPYVRMITTMTQPTASGGHSRSSSEKNRIFILDLIHSLTALTMACFLLAVLYDFQYPEDDGSCAVQTTSATCLAPKMLLDPAESQCVWHEPIATDTGSEADRIIITEILNGQVVNTIPITSSEDTAPSGYCTFNSSNNSSLAFVLSFLITALFANIFSMFLERCMVILNAQSSGPSSQPFDPASGPATTQHLEPLSKERQRAMGYAATLRSYSVEGVEALRRQRAESQALERQRRMNPTAEYDTLLQLKGPEGVDDNERDIETMQMRPTEVTAAVSPPPHLSRTAWQALQAASPTDKAVMMLRTAVADVVSLSAVTEPIGGDDDTAHTAQRQAKYRRHVFRLAVERAFPPVAVVGHLWVWQTIVAATLVMLNGGALYFIISKAAVRGYDWQVSFLKIAAWEWISDVVLMQGCEVWLFDYCLCGLVWNDVQAASRQLEIADRSIVAEGLVAERSSSMLIPMTDAVLATEMIDWFPSLPEALWIRSLLSHHLAGGMRPPSREFGSSTVESTSRPTWASWMHYRTLYVLSWLPLDGWVGIESFTAPMLLAWVIYLYYIYVAPALSDVSTVDVIVLVVVLVTAALVVAGLVVYRRTGQRVQPHGPIVLPDLVVATALPLSLPPENIGHRTIDDPSSKSSRSGDIESIAYLEVDAVDKEGDLDAMSRVERERFYSSISNSSRWCFSETFTDILVDDDAGVSDNEHDTAAEHRHHDTDGAAGAVPARARFYSEASSSWVWSGSDEDDDEAGKQADQPSGPRQSSSSSSASSSGDSESDSHDDELSLPFSMSVSSHESVIRSPPV